MLYSFKKETDKSTNKKTMIYIYIYSFKVTISQDIHKLMKWIFFKSINNSSTCCLSQIWILFLQIVTTINMGIEQITSLKWLTIKPCRKLIDQLKTCILWTYYNYPFKLNTVFSQQCLMEHVLFLMCYVWTSQN